MDKDDFYLAVLLFICLVSAVFGLGWSIYGFCVVAEWWVRLLLWFCSIACLVGGIFVIWAIKVLYFDEE